MDGCFYAKKAGGAGETAPNDVYLGETGKKGGGRTKKYRMERFKRRWNRGPYFVRVAKTGVFDNRKKITMSDRDWEIPDFDNYYYQIIGKCH